MKRTLLAIFLLFFMALTGCSNEDQSIENNAQQEISKDEAENIVLKQLESDYKLAVSYKFSREQQKVWELRFITDFEPKLIKMVELDAKTGAIIREQEFEKVDVKILKGISKDEAEHVVLQKF